MQHWMSALQSFWTGWVRQTGMPLGVGCGFEGLKWNCAAVHAGLLLALCIHATHSTAAPSCMPQGACCASLQPALPLWS